MDGLAIVKIAEPIDELVDEVLSLLDGESFALLDEFEHILDSYSRTPLLQSSSSMYTFSSSSNTRSSWQIFLCLTDLCRLISDSIYVRIDLLSAWLSVFPDSFC
jgi:hypothetical protein